LLNSVNTADGLQYILLNSVNTADGLPYIYKL
jgi:hypothetical protein